MQHAVITGTSLISPAGRTADEAFAACLARRCAGIDPQLPAPFQRIPLAVLPHLPELEVKDTDRSAALALLAAKDALDDAGIEPHWMRRDRSAVVVGTSKAGTLSILSEMETRAGGAADVLWRRGAPSCVLEAICNAYYPGGDALSIVAACATGLLALARGAALIAEGRADTVLVVASDATIHSLFVGSFWRMGVLATWQDTPEDACRPFSVDRRGFVLGEGAGAVVLQSPSAAAESKKTRVSIASWACGSQANDLVSAQSGASVMADLLRTAIARAGWETQSLNLIHAHGTGTIAGDLAESQAISSVLGPCATHVPVLTTKQITGHMLGAAGLAQAVLTVKAQIAGLIPPAANYAPDVDCPICCNSQSVITADIRRAACLASGFGGSTAALTLQHD